MRQLLPITMATMALIGCGGGQRVNSPAAPTQAEPTPAAAPAAEPASPAAEPATAAAPAPAAASNEFALKNSDTAKDARGAKPSKIKPTPTEAALRLFVVDKDKGPVEGIVIFLTAPDGKKYYTEDTDAEGYAEVLVPVGQKYELVYLSLGRQDIGATVAVSNERNQNIKLTLRYKRERPPKTAEPTRVVLSGVNFDTAKATLRPESFMHLDAVVEYMRHKKKARLEISGHTDSVGSKQSNKVLSENRAKACRDYLISKGIEASRLKAVGYGDERPVATNDTDEGRQKNRRMEATEQ